MSPTPSIELTFHGHACIGLRTPTAHLCIDPVPAAGFAGFSDLLPLPDHFTHAVATHAHADHSAFREVTSACALPLPGLREDSVPGLRIESRLAPHDEYGGRLRGGMTHLLRITVDDAGAGPLTIVHAGDLGEVPAGGLLAWLRERPIDVLILPVGGYYVLSPWSALETICLCRPRTAVPVHAADQGIPLPVMAPLEALLRLVPAALRVSSWRPEHLPDPDTSAAPHLTVLEPAGVRRD